MSKKRNNLVISRLETVYKFTSIIGDKIMENRKLTTVQRRSKRLTESSATCGPRKLINVSRANARALLPVFFFINYFIASRS